MRRHFSTLAYLCVASAAQGQGGDAVQNWFDDPFFQLSSFIADCPTPAGPFVSESERRVQAHRRLEKGTTCWLAHECERPNAYAYDQDIAQAIQAAAQEPSRFQDTSLWVTVQGRVVYIEGCAGSEATAQALEAFARALPYVQQAIAIIRTQPMERPPYKVLQSK